MCKCPPHHRLSGCGMLTCWAKNYYLGQGNLALAKICGSICTQGFLKTTSGITHFLGNACHLIFLNVLQDKLRMNRQAGATEVSHPSNDSLKDDLFFPVSSMTETLTLKQTHLTRCLQWQLLLGQNSVLPGMLSAALTNTENCAALSYKKRLI